MCIWGFGGLSERERNLKALSMYMFSERPWNEMGEKIRCEMTVLEQREDFRGQGWCRAPVPGTAQARDAS